MTDLRGPIMAVVGDSYTAGFGASTQPNQWNYAGAWWNCTAAELGWQVGPVHATPGGGYQQPGDFGTFADVLRAHPLPADTDWVIVQGGLNDSNGPDPAKQQAAVADVAGLIRKQAPAAGIVLVGMFNPFPNTVSTPTMLPMARVIGRAAESAGVRYMAGFLLEFAVSPDKVHPTAAGHTQIGHWVARRLRTSLDNGKPLVLDEANGWWAP